MTIRVLIADDQSVVRAGLSTILNSQPDIEVVGQAADGAEAVALARRLRPDVCLFDIRMPNVDGIEATRLLAGPEVSHPIAVVVITTFDTDEYVHGALKAGARGFLLKGAAPEQLIQAVRVALDGDALIDPGVTARLLASFSASSRAAVAVQPIEALTEREEGVLLALARGPHKRRDRRRASHQCEHSQVPRRQLDDQARSAKPRRARHVGLRNKTRQLDAGSLPACRARCSRSERIRKS
jgi:DNA-binding NarL/FixJ family response regulator